jgi:hypothetical protein
MMLSSAEIKGLRNDLFHLHLSSWYIGRKRDQLLLEISSTIPKYLNPCVLQPPAVCNNFLDEWPTCVSTLGGLRLWACPTTPHHYQNYQLQEDSTFQRTSLIKAWISMAVHAPT